MESNKTLEALEEEIKLMKGEMKQSLASVRDYLLNMELPSSEFSTILAALGDGGNQQISIKSIFSNDTGAGLGKSPRGGTEEATAEEPEDEEPASRELAEKPFESESELSPEDEDLYSPDESFRSEAAMPPEDELTSHGESLGPEVELFPEEDEEIGEPWAPDEQDESLMPESWLPEEEKQQMEREKVYAEVSQSTPKVNLMANLINWVAKAKKEIGYEQLPIFLEVYGISGHLSPELKEVIMHLSDITSEPSEDANTAEVWSQSILSLHGILTGGDAPLHPVKPSWHDDSNEIQTGEDEITEAEVDKPKDQPLKLKLIFPNGDGKSKEFCLDLSPSIDDGES